MRARVRPLVVVPILLAVGLAAPAVPADAACASSHLRAALSNFDWAAGPQPFYLAVEDDGSATFTVKGLGDDCVGNTMTVAYDTGDLTATAGVDYTRTSGRTPPLNDAGHPDDAPGSVVEHPVEVPIHDDPDAPVAEALSVSLSDPVGGSVSTPSSANVYIIDNDVAGTELGFGGPYAQAETQGQVRVPVFRAGPAASQATVNFTLSPGPSNPATPGSDYSGSSGTVTIPASQRVGTVDFTIVNDTEPEAPEEVTIELSGPSGATLGSPSTSTFTIIDNEEAVFPVSRFHHPRHRLKYKKNDYRLREMHIFTEDAGGSGVVGAELALMQKMKNGRCKWWNGKRFRGGKCGERRWLSLPQYEPDFFYYRIPALRASMGKTKVRSYTAFSRAIDGAGNVENTFEKKRNANTFEVKKKRKRRA